MPEVLRTSVVGEVTLAPPTATFDPVTRALVDREVAAAEARGHATGRAEGRAAATEDTTRAVAAVVAAVDRLHAELADQRTQAVTADLDLVGRIVTAVLGACPPEAAEVVVERIRDAVARLDDDVLDVRVHPDDHAAVAAVAFDGRVRLSADPRTAPGEAAVDGEWGRAELTRAALATAALEAIAVGGTA